MTERGKSIQEECEDWATRIASQGTLLKGRADLKLRGFGDTDWELANWLLRIKQFLPEETSYALKLAETKKDRRENAL